MKIPEKINIANLPTRIEFLERFSKKFSQKNIYIKRDDFTGCEYSGNKIRKLEFALKEAMNKNVNALVTCGGIQSNHARAVASLGAKFGMKVVLVLRGSSDEEVDGNYFLDKILGAEIKFITREEYSKIRMEIMENVAKELKEKGDIPYIIPEGASNGIGIFGYYNCMKEITSQEKDMNIKFDTIVCASGSGGTAGGLILGNKVLNCSKNIATFNVCDDAHYFKRKIKSEIEESLEYTNENINFEENEINVVDGYVGRGYALSTNEELCFLKDFAREEGIILDPVYTGKAMYGLYNELLKGNFEDSKNILFIHTGGLFGLFPKRSEVVF